MRYYLLDNDGFVLSWDSCKQTDWVELEECPNTKTYYWDGEAWVKSTDKTLEEETTAVHAERSESYWDVGDALDAMYKYFNYRRLQGDDFTQELDDWISACTAVKAANPLPTEEDE